MTDTLESLLREARERMRHLPLCAVGYDTDPQVCDCGHDDLLSRIDALLATGGWISVEDRLPPQSKVVLFAAQFDDPTDWRIKCGYSSRSRDDPFKIWGASWRPTHWQPLPTTPKKENGK